MKTCKSSWRHRLFLARLLGPRGPPQLATQLDLQSGHVSNNQIIFHPTGIMQAGTVYMASADGKSGYALSCAVSQVSFLRRYVYDGAWRLIK